MKRMFIRTDNEAFLINVQDVEKMIEYLNNHKFVRLCDVKDIIHYDLRTKEFTEQAEFEMIFLNTERINWYVIV